FLDMQKLGLPLIAGESAVFNRFPLDLFPAKRRAPFVTCSTCTGNELKAAALAARTGGGVAAMVGAARVPFVPPPGRQVGEVRGISNLVGNRDRKGWRVHNAAAAARASLIDWIEAGEC